MWSNDNHNWTKREFLTLLGGLTAAGLGTSDAAGQAAGDMHNSVGYTSSIPSDKTQPPAPSGADESLTAPYPTNDWWTHLLVANDSQPLYSHPLVTRPTDTGLDIGYTDEWAIGDGTGVDTDSLDDVELTTMAEMVYTPFEADLTVRGQNTSDFGQSVVTDYGDWHVEYRLENSVSEFSVTQAKGSPYLFFDGLDAGVELSLSSAPTVFAERGPVLGLTIDGSHYAVIGPSETDWEQSGEASLQSDLGGEGAFTVALLPDDQETTIDRYVRYGTNVVTDTRVEWTYVERENNEVVSEVRTTFEFTVTDRSGGESAGTMTALYPHQHKYLHEGSSTIEGLHYESPRGEMKVVSGSSFTTALSYPGIIPHYPAVDAADDRIVSQFATVISTPDTNLEQFDGSLAATHDVPTLEEASVRWSRLPYIPGKESPADGSYWTGVNINRWSEAAALLGEYGYDSRRDLVLDVLTAQYDRWFQPGDDGEDSPLFFYDERWGTLVGQPSGFGVYAELNDHHFHHGYFVKGASEIARTDTEWAEQDGYESLVNTLIRDYAAPTHNDDQFPFLRTFSPYAGHSYASGINPFALGNNQEASGEAINAYAALIRWGAFTDQTIDGCSIRNLGIFLYTHEVHAALEYWYDWDEQTHPDEWERDYAAVVWDAGYAHSTWWTERAEDTYAINVLPANGDSLYLGWGQSHTSAVYDELVSLAGAEEFSVWPGVLLEFAGFVDPSRSLRRFEHWEEGNFPGETRRYVPDLSNSKLHTYTMLQALATLGSPTQEVVSDATFSHVFIDDAGRKQYLAYNPGSSQLTVTFSDGFQFEVAPGSLEIAPNSLEMPPSATDETSNDGEQQNFRTPNGTSGPGFGAGAAIGGIAGAGYFLHRLGKDDED